jgi:O-antigen ligase
MWTLNRGMMIGLGVAFMFAGARLAARGNMRAIGAMLAAGAIAAGLWFTLPVEEGLATRTAASTESRAALYTPSWRAATESPFFGYGVTVDSPDPDTPKVGTQGQLWMVLVSHGLVAVFCFFSFFIVTLVRSLNRRDAVGLACSTTLLVGTLELSFYGAVPYGLPILMTVAALAVRPPALNKVTRRP